MGRFKTSVLQLAGFYMCVTLFPQLFCVTFCGMYSGELQQAQRVLQLCGKGRGGAVASEASEGALCEIVTLCACELLHVACRDERLGADAGSQGVYGFTYSPSHQSFVMLLQWPCV